jgi:NADH-quinone oxidoreductase subunit M
VAMVQPDMKKLVAYSSVSHLGFVMLGLAVLNTPGVEGSVLQMVNHGLSTGALFIIVGMIYERRHTRQISEFGGIARSMPVFAVFFMIVTLSSIGLPGLNGFVGEFLILLGAFKKSVLLSVLAASGVILAAVYMLWMFKRVVFGPLDKEANRSLKDLSAREIATLVPLVILIVWIGVYPETFLRKMDRSVEVFLARTSMAQAAEPAQAVPPPPAAAEPADLPGTPERVEQNLVNTPETAVPVEEPVVADPEHGIRVEDHESLRQENRPQPDHGHGDR